MLDIIKFLEISKELSLQELTVYIQSFLVENKSKWMERNFVLVYQTSFKYDSLLELQKLCTDIITNEPEKIFESADFTSSTEKSLVSIIQNDNLQISEVKKWEYVLKWGLAQNQGLPSGPASF